jgi:hypothetical protein
MAPQSPQSGYGVDADLMTHLWFRAKTYGWGWYPASIEGWLALGLFLAGVVVDVFVLKHRLVAGSPGAWTIFFAALAVLVGALFAVCWVTGERPHWRWGG